MYGRKRSATARRYGARSGRRRREAPLTPPAPESGTAKLTVLEYHSPPDQAVDVGGLDLGFAVVLPQVVLNKPDSVKSLKKICMVRDKFRGNNSSLRSSKNANHFFSPADLYVNPSGKEKGEKRVKIGC